MTKDSLITAAIYGVIFLMIPTLIDKDRTALKTERFYGVFSHKSTQLSPDEKITTFTVPSQTIPKKCIVKIHESNMNSSMHCYVDFAGFTAR